jgi:hypothetical protein
MHLGACYALIPSHSLWNVLFSVTIVIGDRFIILNFTTSSKPSLIDVTSAWMEFYTASTKHLYSSSLRGGSKT